MTVHAFVDESRRGSYLLAAAMLSPADLTRTRAVLRGLCRPGDRRLHFTSMIDSRRRDVAARLVDAGVHTCVYTGKGRADVVRQACLERLVVDLVAVGGQRLVLESRGSDGDRVDRRVIAGTLRKHSSDGYDRMVYEHLKPYEDPALWIPDAVAWCYGAGGDWRRRVAPIIDQVVDIGAESFKRR